MRRNVHNVQGSLYPLLACINLLQRCAWTLDYLDMNRRTARFTKPLIRKFFVMLLVLAGLSYVAPASANITVAEYMNLRAEAQTGNKGADARWRYYIIGLMDGIQAVQAPAASAGVKLHFCMPGTLPLSPKFLDVFIQEAIGRLSAKGILTERIGQPMALLIALELKSAFPCPE